MIQEVYNISPEGMDSLLNRLRTPSRNQALMREALIRNLQAEIHTVISGGAETDHFENLDLSFLRKFSFNYSKVCISGNHPSVKISVGNFDDDKAETSYQNEEVSMTAA